MVAAQNVSFDASKIRHRLVNMVVILAHKARHWAISRKFAVFSRERQLH